MTTLIKELLELSQDARGFDFEAICIFVAPTCLLYEVPRRQDERMAVIL
jgi:hypothetical protein